MDKYKTKMTINKWFSYISLETLSESSRQTISQFNRYSKKLTFKKVLKLFLYAINDETDSLRHLDQQLVNPNLKKVIDIESISYSQLSRALRKIDPSVLMDIFTQLLSLVHEKTVVQSNERVFLIDSSTFSLNKTRNPWGTFRPTKSGIKLHLKVCHMKEGWVHPEQFELSHASEHDHDHLNVFINEKRATYVFDRGYLDFSQFDQMNWEGYFFVSRIKKNTAVHVQAHLEVSHESGIISDQLVQLGKSTYLTGLFRLVTIERKHQSNLRILTNRMDLSAEAIGKMYQSRWQIELFFKHIKQHLTIKTYYSQSEQGVENQVILAMIVYLLTLLMKLELRLKSSLFTILRQIRALQYEPFAYFKESFAPG